MNIQTKCQLVNFSKKDFLKMWNIILEILKKDLIQKILLVSIIGLLFFVLFKQCEDRRALEWQNEQNRNALLDTVRVIKNKLDEDIWIKTAFAAKLEDMEKLNKKLYDEVKSINGKVKTLQNVDAKMIIDKIVDAINKPTEVGNDNKGYLYKFPWEFKNEIGSFSYNLLGSTYVVHDTLQDTVIIDKTILEKQSYTLALKTFITEDKDGTLIGGVAPIVPTEGLSFSIETGIFDPIMSKKFLKASERKNVSFGIGPYIGVGYKTIWNPGGDPSTFKGLGWSFGLGLNLSYNLF